MLIKLNEFHQVSPRELRAFRMELFLNLCWLSLLAPAYWIWRQRPSSISLQDRRKRPAARTLVFLCALGCVFVLLFPVISASDDLHAIRAEMEESSPGKRSVCQAAGERSVGWHSRCQNLAVVATAASLDLTRVGQLELLAPSLSVPVTPSIFHVGRAPPRSCSGCALA